MTSIETPSRLHLGLINSGPPVDGRRFGGAGLMIDRPGNAVRIEPGDRWSFHGPLAERVAAVAARFRELNPQANFRPARVVVERTARDHAGLGTGTQVSLAVVRLLAANAGADIPSADQLAAWGGRGQRSGIGVHGFVAGGFIVDAGRAASEPVVPLARRVEFPKDWRIILVLPPSIPGLHGQAERDAFERMERAVSEARIRRLRTLAGELADSLAARDFLTFAGGAYEFNRLAGEAFSSIQGGVYAHPRIAEVVEWLHAHDIRGAGQSSWGPAIFGFVPDAAHAEWLADKLRQGFGWSEIDVLVGCGDNRGAVVIDSDP